MKLAFCVACGATDDLQHHHLVTRAEAAAMMERTSSRFAMAATQNCTSVDSTASTNIAKAPLPACRLPKRAASNLAIRSARRIGKANALGARPRKPQQ